MQHQNRMESTTRRDTESDTEQQQPAETGGELHLQLKGASFAEGEAALSPGTDVHSVAQAGVSGGGGAAPHLEAVQRSFGGHDISGVQAHTGGKAAEAATAIGASAYATGSDVAFAHAPDLHTAAHEYAHVVQQRAGVQLSGGVGAAGDAYERHADQVADLVVGGQSAEPKLTEMAGGQKSGPAGAVQSRAVQRKGTGDKTAVADLSPASMETIIQAAKASKVWPSLVKSYADKTTWGYVELDPSTFGDMSMELMIWVDERYKLADENNKSTQGLTDRLLDDPALQQTLVRAVRTSVFEGAPTAVWGMVAGDIKLTNEDGKAVTAKTGKVVKLVRAQDSQTFEVEGTISQQKATGTMDAALFIRQPGLTTYDHDEDASTAEVRQEYGNVDFAPDEGQALTPDGKAPKVSDVSQGAIGDCYLMAGMGAVVAQRPDLIQKMVTYDSGIYTVTFKERQGGVFVDVPIQVDSNLPSKGGTNPIYGQDTATKGGNDAALWPAIVEKAYAVWKGDYQEIAGGSPSKAMEAITGARSSSPAVPAEDKVIAQFKQYVADKKAVCGGTVNSVLENKAKLFSGSGNGPFKAKLPGSEGASAKVVPGSVRITDTVGKGGTARDDKNGALTGGSVKAGSVAYKGGATELSYTDTKAPTAAEDLEAAYRYKGKISTSLNLYGNHAYMFVGVEGDKLIFANPWGSNPDWQPKPVSAAQFVALFDLVS
ncbi:MAG: hypothetical protein ACI9MR_004983, partial [Myxococcota bacterium]